jgi:two-component system, cell cycle sensor histidine kinase and response regulator CckA
MSKASILVVEDEFITAESLRDQLETLGYNVSGIVASGQRAIEEAESKRPDLVLMDIVLQNEMDGIEAAKQISSRFDIPFIYLTAYSDESIVERAKITKPSGYLIKPFVDRELQISIELALYKHAMDKHSKENEEQLNAIMEAARDSIFVKDSSLRYILVNPSMESFLELPASELIGRTDEDSLERR